MSVLTKGLAMDFEREGKVGCAVTSIWPAVVCSFSPLLSSSVCRLLLSIVNEEKRQFNPQPRPPISHP